MRLNLSNYNCAQFALFSEFTASPNQDAAIQSIMDQTVAFPFGPDEEEGEEEARIAIFGNRYNIGGLTHQAQGSLSKTEGEDAGYSLVIMARRSPDDLPRPPRGIRPVSVLVEALSKLPEPVNVNCEAMFEYDYSQGYGSAISWPIPLVATDAIQGITHIESAEFSRRDGDEIQYSITVTSSEDPDLLVHSVDFESSVRLNARAVREMLNKAHSISSQLVIQAGE